VSLASRSARALVTILTELSQLLGPPKEYRYDGELQVMNTGGHVYYYENEKNKAERMHRNNQHRTINQLAKEIGVVPGRDGEG
jgi:hypothetical protein